MKKFNKSLWTSLHTLPVLVMLPLSALASHKTSNYTYDCQADAQGDEALCLAEPNDAAPAPKAQSATGSTAGDGSSAKPGQSEKLVFGAAPPQSVKQGPGLTQRADSATKSMAVLQVQEKIQHVQDILRQNQTGVIGGPVPGQPTETSATVKYKKK